MEELVPSLKRNVTRIRAKYRDKLKEALTKSYEKIKEGKSSLEAVEAAIVVMEDSPLFNAGKGAVLPVMAEMSWMLL